MDEPLKSVLLRTNDPRLAALIRAETEDGVRDALERIVVDHARPVIDAVLSRTRNSILRTADREDVAAAMTLRLIVRLKRVPSSEEEAIASLDDFVATLTYNAIYDIIRRRFPERARLKNRIRYVITHDPRFAMYTGEGVGAGLASWPAPGTIEPLADGESFAEPMPDRKRTGDAVELILRHTGRAVLLDDLVRVLAEVWQITEAPGPASVSEYLPEKDPSPLVRFEARQYLTSVWSEICELPRHQRMALLLNLRDPEYRNAIALFVMIGIASADRIAEVLEMSTEALAEIWNELPLDDQAISAMLDVPRQKVINYRRSARERLARRLKRTI